MDWDAIIGLAERLADAARAEIRPRFQKTIATERKADVTPVTEADRAAETAIRALLAAERPDDAIVGEEYGHKAGTSGYTWVVDPIDGTKAFMTGRATFVTLIALLDGERPVLGVIDQPITGDRWIGVSGRRTTHNGAPVETRNVPALADATFSTTDPNLFPTEGAAVYKRISGAASIRTYGGDGLAYGLLASGWIDIVLESGLKLYDFAALVPVVEGAGGVITDWAGRPVNAGSDGSLLVAGSAALHAQLLKLT
ncbi:MAG TPA: histidinol-phosphatase [Alphaproteobacteria bacterium]|jgi:histidinol phosphatase-like enzyme (inositol monophosphatase family)|nr:histidinol-phosphatase [Alphaproteobacteria bacterium]